MFVETIDEKCTLLEQINEEINRSFFAFKKLPFTPYNRLFLTHFSRLRLHRFMHVVTVSILVFHDLS